MSYFHKTPYLLTLLYPELTWRNKKGLNTIYLTFDDGPVPEATPLVLEILRKRNIKATFFCVGDNIRKHPEIFYQVFSEGHTIGNHTFNHLNGWLTESEEYCENIKACNAEIEKHNLTTSLFRPPYGKIKRSQIKKITENYQVVMWDVLSGDFDQQLSANKCLKKTIKSTSDGSIVIFHDSIKSLDKIRQVLPDYIDHFLDKGYKFMPL